MGVSYSTCIHAVLLKNTSLEKNSKGMRGRGQSDFHFVLRPSPQDLEILKPNGNKLSQIMSYKQSFNYMQLQV